VLNDHVENAEAMKNIKNQQKTTKVIESHLKYFKKQLNKLTFYLVISRQAEKYIHLN
jgi:hypothetical protein